MEKFQFKHMESVFLLYNWLKLIKKFNSNNFGMRAISD